MKSTNNCYTITFLFFVVKFIKIEDNYKVSTSREQENKTKNEMKAEYKTRELV
jgi:hypothetical protein